MEPLKVTLPRLHGKRGPKTLRGKIHASRNALKYGFSDVRRKDFHDTLLLDALKAKLISEADPDMPRLDLDAITTAIIKAYRIRSEIEETTLKLAQTLSLSPVSRIESYLKHLEGLRRYERRAHSRLMTLTRPHHDPKHPRIRVRITHRTSTCG